MYMYVRLSLLLQGDVSIIAQDMARELGLTNQDIVAVPVSLQVSCAYNTFAHVCACVCLCL